jgi:GTP-binding protein
LNALLGRRIARVSATPGKTRALNVYEIPGSGVWGVVPDGAPQSHGPNRQGPLPTPHSLYFLDLPGYGYARASKADRTAFAGIVRHVLHRPRLAGVVWLLDIRHEPSEGDRTMQDLLAGAETRVLVAATKSDKLSQAQQRQREQALRQALALDEDQVVVTSVRTGLGLPELRESIAVLAREA